MSKTAGWTAEDFMGLWAVIIIGGGAFAFRELAIVPRATVGMCAVANAPAICVPREMVLKGQYYGLFGWAALALGLAAFFRAGRFGGAVALGLGVAAVVNYNGTQGILGASLGLIVWLSAMTGRAAKA
ncbi:hypothetical protein [Acidocella sp.]|uniref:hypothetical protein n=1 Tax=Acidocella sp. TaxID=50710 RepID=UPI00262CAD63|nr:hypothetical protein [Acidocella sp.]